MFLENKMQKGCVMETYVLSCCSTMDLSKAWAEEHGVNLIYAKYYLGEEEFLDDFYASLPQEKLFSRMLSGEKSRTTQINTEDYVESFRKFLSAGKDIFHICLSSGVSGTFNSCHIARDILLEEFPERKIEIVDSLMASSGYGLLVDKAYALKQEGLSIDALKREVEKWRSRLHAYFFTSDLRFFIQGGRVSKAAGFIGGILKICPVLMITGEGTLKPIEKARGKKQAIENVLSKMEKAGYLPSGSDSSRAAGGKSSISAGPLPVTPAREPWLPSSSGRRRRSRSLAESNFACFLQV